MKKTLIFCIAALLLLSFFIPIRRSINETFSCIVFDQMDDGFRGSTQVTFSGVYSDYLFRRDSFQSRVDCPDYSLMTENASHTLLNIGERIWIPFSSGSMFPWRISPVHPTEDIFCAGRIWN